MNRKEIINNYSMKYKKHQRVLTKVLFPLILLFGVAVLAAGIYLAIAYQDLIFYIICGICVIASGVDVFIGIKFLKFSLKNIDEMKDYEAALRYARIYGFSLDKEIEEKK